MSNSEVSALLIGATIALVSSLLTTLTTSLFNYWLSRKNQRREKISKLHFLVGKTSADINQTHDTQELVKFWQIQKKELENFVSAGDENDLEGLTGMLESLSGKIKKLEEQSEILQTHSDVLKNEISLMKRK